MAVKIRPRRRGAASLCRVEVSRTLRRRDSDRGGSKETVIAEHPFDDVGPMGCAGDLEKLHAAENLPHLG